jgi:hypothetical protein
MRIKIFVRTFTSVEDAEMFNSVLHTKWPMLQKDIEAIIAQEIVRFTKALPNKEMHFQGEVDLDFNEA